jgi:hypothetical protein
VVASDENPFGRCARDNLDLGSEHTKIVGTVLSNSLLVNVVPKKKHRRRNTTRVERRHGGLHVLQYRVIVEFLGPGVTDQEKHSLLIV